jgi:hypothetical protein
MATLDQITQGALRRWLDGPAAVEIASVTQFDVPGAEIASRVKKLDPGIKETLELVSRGMSFLSEGEQHDGENRRLRIRMLTGGSEQKRCDVVTAAGRQNAYSRDGRRFGRLRSASSPVETELAIRPLLEHDLGDRWTETPQGGWRATLDADDIAAVVDLERILGPRGRAAPSGYVETRCVEDEAEVLVELMLGADAEAIQSAVAAAGGEVDEDTGGGVSSVTRTHMRLQRRDVPAIPLPEISPSIPDAGTLRQCFSLVESNRPGRRRRR